MRATGIVRRFDDLGRINIPKEIRRQLFGTKCTGVEPIEIFIDGENIILRKYEEDESDDVCEWEYVDAYSYYKVGCKENIVPIQYGDYCPYCGKKINVVE